MRTSEEFDKVTAFGKYHAQGVIDALQIPEDDFHARQAVKFIFKVMADECRNPQISQTENNRWALDLTYDKTQKRYELYRLYAPYFFPKDHEIDHDALVTAIICDEYIVHANELIQNPQDPEECMMRDDGFDEDVLLRASILFDECLNFDIQNPPDVTMPELAFLLHVNAFETLEEIQSSLNENEFEFSELRKILEEDLEEIRMMAWTWTEFGRDIRKFADHLATEIEEMICPQPPRKPHLSLVPPLPQ